MPMTNTTWGSNGIKSASLQVMTHNAVTLDDKTNMCTCINRPQNMSSKSSAAIYREFVAYDMAHLCMTDPTSMAVKFSWACDSRRVISILNNLWCLITDHGLLQIKYVFAEPRRIGLNLISTFASISVQNCDLSLVLRKLYVFTREWWRCHWKPQCTHLW